MLFTASDNSSEVHDFPSNFNFCIDLYNKLDLEIKKEKKYETCKRKLKKHLCGKTPYSMAEYLNQN